MKNKRILVLGVALVLFAVVAGVAFAGSMNGVQWSITDTGITISNGNDYAVRVVIERADGTGIVIKYLDAYETKVFLGEYSGVQRVSKDRS